MASVAEVLERAADLLQKPGAWTQGVLARNKAGEITGLSEFRGPAVCWCILGATYVVDNDDDDDRSSSNSADRFLESLLGEVGAWNDAPERTQSEVVAKLREAAALAREQGK
jgi:hypothetical protein